MIEEIQLPSAVQDCLDQEGHASQPIWLGIDTDVLLDGSPSQFTPWLIANRSGIVVVAPSAADDHRYQIARHIGWEDVQAVRTVSGVGSGLLQLQVDDQWIDFLRFTNALGHRFHKVSRFLDNWSQEDLLSDDTVAESMQDDDFSFDPPKCPSCNLRLSKKDVSCPRCLQRGQIMQRIMQILKPHWKGATVLCLLTVVGVAAELIPPKLQQYMVDHLLNVNRLKDGEVATVVDVDVRTALLLVVLALAGSRIMMSIVGVIKGRVSSVIGSGITCTLRLQMVEKLQRLAVSYYDRHHVGSMISRVAHDSEVLHGLMHQVTGGFLLQIVKLFGVGFMLFTINAKLALFTLIPIPLVFYGTWFFWRKVYPRYYRLWDASSKQMSALSGMLHGIRVVKAFAQEDREFRKFQSAAEHLRDWKLWVEYANARYSATMQVVFGMGGLIVWYVGGLDVIPAVGASVGKMTLGELIAFLAYLSMFYAPLGALSNFTTWLTSFLSGSKRVMELLDSPLSVSEPENPVAWDKPRGAIEFDNVTFGYDRNQPVLKNISFEVGAGEMVGIVGRSGSGKTTMVNLLGRFYDPQEGEITIDGHDVRELSMTELRQHLGIVFQDSFLFRGTVWNNLSYGRPHTDIEEGLAAAKAAGAHDFICRKQLGYETQLGEHGSGLSGGEKQRLSIARTLLYDPRILVLDEATSNIDAEAEKGIQDALEVLIRGRTTIAIAHRLSTLRNADRILVFDRGRLVEQGSHAELLSMEDGVYSKLVRIQTQVSKDPNVDKLLHHSDSDGAANNRQRSLAVSEDGAIGETSSGSQSATATLVAPDGSGFGGEDDSNEKPSEAQAPALHWLDPTQDHFVLRDGALVLQRGSDEQRVFLIRTFPATHPSSYVSVRVWNEGGDDDELGIIRNVADWPENQQTAIRMALDRRYLLRRISSIHSLKLDFGFLEFDVETDSGRYQFTTRWTNSKAIAFGENGKLLIDTDDNRYIVPDVNLLPQKDRDVFLQYVYW